MPDSRACLGVRQGGGAPTGRAARRSLARSEFLAIRDCWLLHHARRGDEMSAGPARFADRRAAAAAKLRERELAALLVTPGADLLYLTGYQLNTSERLTCLVLDRDGKTTLVCPELEAPRAGVAAPDLARAVWGETADPYALVAS